MELKKVYLLFFTLPAYLLWFFTFRITLWTFWHRMIMSTTILLIISLYFRREVIKDIRLGNISSKLPKGLLGIIHGLLTYLLVYAGFQLFKEYVVDGASEVYLFRYGLDLAFISVILLFTSISEEVYWRGFIQHNLQESMNQYLAIFKTSFLYSTIHIWTLNLPLIFIAFIMGFFWGFLYTKTKSILSCILSHITWDELVFVLLPLIDTIR